MASIAYIVDQFEASPAATAQTLAEWIESDPIVLCEQLAPVLRQLKDGPGCQHLLWLISGSKFLPRILCDPSLLSDDEASVLAERLRQIEPAVESTVFREIFGPDGTGGISLSAPDFGLRFLHIFCANSNSVRLLSVVGRLLRHPSAKIRSKAAILIGKMSRQYEWLELTRHEKDDRVRANALEALWEPGIPLRFRSLLWDAARDHSSRVAGNALLGLYRQGEAGCIPLIAEMTHHADERFRATAAWVIGETGDDRFRHDLVPLLESSSSLVRQNAREAIAKLHAQANFTSVEELQLVLLSGGMYRAQSTRNHSAATDHTAPNASPAISPSHTIRLGVVTRQNRPAPVLVATDFLLIRDSSFIERYAVHPEPLPETLSVSFAIPVDGGNFARSGWRALLSELFEQKRHLDYWGAVEYAANGDSQNGPIDFLQNSGELDNFFTTRAESNVAVHFVSSLELLLTLPPWIPTAQCALHAVVIESNHSAELSLEQLAGITSTALERGFHIHLLSPNPSSPLRQLTEATGGAFLVCPAEIESWRRNLSLLYASFSSTYRIEFELPENRTAAREIQVEVRRGPLRGEIRVPLGEQKQ